MELRPEWKSHVTTHVTFMILFLVVKHSVICNNFRKVCAVWKKKLDVYILGLFMIHPYSLNGFGYAFGWLKNIRGPKEECL